MSVYLDHAASTPVRAEATDAYLAAAEVCGNASSLHSAGRRARKLLEEARERLAHTVGARPEQVVFTSGGTEADNLAVKGLFRGRRDQDPRRRRIVLPRIEHHAVLDTVEWLAEREGAQPVWLDVDATGRVDPASAQAAIAQAPDETALVSVMWANNEVGTLQPVAEVAAIAHEHGIPFHTDAVQAVGAVPVDFATSGVDALSLTGHKLGGPIGAGALVIKRGLPVVAQIHGGGQEQGLRSGTSNVPGVSGLSVAAQAAVDALPDSAARVAALRDALVAGVRRVVPDAQLSGAPLGEARLPGNAHLRFPGCEGDSLTYLLDAAGIECSTGSACQAGVPQASHVLLAMGIDPVDAHGALRFSVGHTSTMADVERLTAVIGEVVERARSAGLASVGAGR